jgi:hypothetical protein
LYNKNSKYPFLNEKLTKEAHIEDILSEIEGRQSNWLRHESNELATVENLSESRNIKIPLTQKRLMNIQYLLDLLVKNHPTVIRPVFLYKFFVNTANKNIKIEEKAEYTFMMKDPQFNQLQLERDKESTESVNELIKNFRFFNLTRLLLKSKNRNHLIDLIKNQLGINIFTFKYFSLDKNSLLIDEDYCFHRDNYEAVKSKLDLDEVKRIIALNEHLVDRRLKSVGILNSNVNDYRDNKLDYILNILSDHLPQSFDKSNEIKVKNFKHLRECIIKVDKLLDPISRLDREILNYLREKFITTDSDIISLFPDLTNELLNQWKSEKKSSGKLIVHNYKNTKYFIDSGQFIGRYEPLVNSIVNHADLPKTDEITYGDSFFTVDLLTDAGKTLLEANQNLYNIFGSNENVEKLKSLIDKYLHNDKRLMTMSKTIEQQDKKGILSFFKKIIYAIIMLFKSKKQDQPDDAKKTYSTKKSIKEISETTRNLYEEIAIKSSILTPISDFIQIKPENQDLIETLITDLRRNNLKTVIPIYDARKNLYVKRGRKYLISDVEYLLADPDIASSPEDIYDFIDSIAGFQLKEDTLSTNALIIIEKYLLSLYRHEQAKKKRKKKYKN